MSSETAGVSRETPAGGAGGVRRRRGPAGRALTWLALAPIRAYRRFVSPLLGPRCRYYPTCSAYAEQAVRELGPLRGAIVAAWRVLRCNPLSAGGLDPLEDRSLFRSAPDPNGRTSPKPHAQ
jgi:putative membrane protein insertion efficiency factor